MQWNVRYAVKSPPSHSRYGSQYSTISAVSKSDIRAMPASKRSLEEFLTSLTKELMSKWGICTYTLYLTGGL